MSDKVKPADLKPCDVLLYHGTAFISRMICLFDGSEYSHAAIYDGTNIAEALGKGITSDPVATSVQGAKYVDVFRFHSDSGAQLRDTGYPEKPVLDRVAFYVGNPERYAYEEIVFLALLATTRRLPVVGWVPGLGALLRTVLDSAADVLNKIIATGKEPMICSELVYRCYAEAGANYHLKIAGAQMLMRHSLHESALLKAMPLAAPEGDRELQELAAAAEVFLQSYAVAQSGREMPKGKRGAAKASKEEMRGLALPVVADFVTPRDLKTSPNLIHIGRLEG